MSSQKLTKASEKVSTSTDSTKEKKTEKCQIKDVFDMEDDVFKPTKNYQARKKIKIPMINPNIASQTMKKKFDSDNETDDISGLIDQYRKIKKRLNVDDTGTAEVRNKVKRLFNEQHAARKQVADKFFTNCSEIITQIGADYDVMKENQQKLGQLTTSLINSVENTTTIFKEKWKSLSKIHSLKKQFDEIETCQTEEQEVLMCELNDDIKKLQEKMEKETKKQAWEQMCRRISNAMQNN